MLSFNPKYESEKVAAFSNSSDAVKDQPLQYTWSIWEQLAQSVNETNYSNQTRRFASFATVQEFWHLWNHIPQPSELVDNKKIVRETPDGQANQIDALMIFRDSIRPEWEDPNNAKGGHLQFVLRPTLGGAQIDEYWNNLILGVIGGTIEPAGFVTGIRLVDKLSARGTPMIRIELWFNDVQDKAAVEGLQKSAEKCMATKMDNTMGAIIRSEVKEHKATRH